MLSESPRYSSDLLSRVDGRIFDARRFKNLLRAYEEEFCPTTEAKRSLVRTAATLTLSLEDMQAARLRGESVDAGELTRLAGQQRRVLADLRRNTEASAPAALSLHDHLAVSHDDDEGHEEDAD
jgi:hypothetical protein